MIARERVHGVAHGHWRLRFTIGVGVSCSSGKSVLTLGLACAQALSCALKPLATPAGVGHLTMSRENVGLYHLIKIPRRDTNEGN